MNSEINNCKIIIKNEASENETKSKKIYKPGLLRDVDKFLVEKLSDEEKIQFTIDGYDRVANDWDKTRQNFWPELISEIIKSIKPNTKILDLGCGNGRLIPEITKLNKSNENKLESPLTKYAENYNINYVGVDPSKELIKIAKEKYPSYDLRDYDGLVLSDFQDEEFDQVISIAVLHHIPPANVVTWLKEANRVAKKNTVSIFTTWNLSESNYDLNQNADAVIGFVHHKNTRYVHYYDHAEIRDIFEKSGYSILEIKEIRRESGMSNTVIIVRK